MAKINLKECGFCGREVYKLANPSRGLCAPCYYREKKNGTLEYKEKRVRATCRVVGCGQQAIALKLCEAHYRRLRKHGVLEHERFDRWGHKDCHPLRDAHYNIVRYGPDKHSPEWADFWTFVADVGDRPEKHRLKRINELLPWGKDNFYWRPPNLDIDCSTREGRNAYARAYRAANPELYRDKHMRKRYGATLEWYNAKLAEQDGACAICKQPETAIARKTGLPRELAIDHCHASNGLRGLLCSNCNMGLGSFKDNPQLLRAAIIYLESETILRT